VRIRRSRGRSSNGARSLLPDYSLSAACRCRRARHVAHRGLQPGRQRECRRLAGAPITMLRRVIAFETVVPLLTGAVVAIGAGLGVLLTLA
jgi:hypothetical protein